MIKSVLTYIKPSFAYLYTAFVISLIILVILSLLFHQRLNLLVRYSDEADHAYNVLMHFEQLENSVKDFETTGRGFMLTKDTQYLGQMNDYLAEIQPRVDSLRKLLEEDSSVYERLNQVNRLISKRVALQKRNIARVLLNDTAGLVASFNEGEYYMNQIREQVHGLRTSGLRRSKAMEDQKKMYENLTPGYFNYVLLFSVIITLVAFFYINSEIKIRLAYQKELERRLVELNRSYDELEQFTFVASHDLQEPLRKIRTFSDRLLTKYTTDLDPKARNIIERMDVSAGRLQELISDITNFSALINKEESPGTVNLNEIVENVLSEYKSLIEERNIQVVKEYLPVVNGYTKQLVLLFTSLIDNAIKFSNIAERPSLKIRYELAGPHLANGLNMLSKSYHKVSIEDNGIGFDNEFADKIFMIFQRLHSQQSGYRGKGMGLAIAQRVMVNHNGLIAEKGNPGKGAEFTLYFPVES